MGAKFAQFNCCNNASADDSNEVKNFYSSSNNSSRIGSASAAAQSKHGSSIVKGQDGLINNNTTVDFSGMAPVGGVSGMTKNSSSAQTNTVGNKKVLQFRLFKSLKDARDIAQKYQVGRVLGKGSFGEVRECVNV